MWHQIQAIGNLGRDPELRYTPSGAVVCSFSIAVNKSYTTSTGEQVKQTIWLRVATWAKLAENCNQYLKKGSRVMIVGELQPDKSTGGPRIWEKSDGSSGASFEVNAQTVRFLSNRGEDHSSPQDGGTEIPPEDDVPF